MGKLVLANVKDFREAMKQGRTAVKDTARIVRAHARQISYDDKIAQLEKSVGSKVDSILKAFTTLSNAVAKRVGKTGLTATAIITMDVINDILTPYNEYLNSMGGASSIEDAVAYIEGKRKRELETYGKSEFLVGKINRYFDLQIHKYLLPLRSIEAQINSMNERLKFSGERYNTITSTVNKLLLTTEDANVVEEIPAEVPVVEATEKKKRAKKPKQTKAVEQTIG